MFVPVDDGGMCSTLEFGDSISMGMVEVVITFAVVLESPLNVFTKEELFSYSTAVVVFIFLLDIFEEVEILDFVVVYGVFSLVVCNGCFVDRIIEDVKAFTVGLASLSEIYKKDELLLYSTLVVVFIILLDICV